MKPNAWFVALVALIVFVADQASKFAVVSWLGMGGTWTPFPGRPDLLALTVGINTGTACGYFPQTGMLFAFAPFIIVAIVLIFYRQQAHPGWLLSLGTGLIIGGAFGNLADRLRLGGSVIDFIYVWHWPVFNVADAAVSTAVVLLLFWSLREEAGQPANADGTPAARGGASWKLLLSFLVLLGILAVLGVLVCVIIPANLFR
jgi:signal peptidase II